MSRVSRVICLAGAATCLLATPAAAFHIPGADYSGYASGGGSISFTVSSDGSSVTNLALNGPIRTGDCTLSSAHYSQPVPIRNNNFDNGEVSGGFPNVRGAYGHFSIPVAGFPTSCRVAGTWSAITAADPAGSAECKKAQARVRKKKHALNRAKRRGNEAKIRKLRAKWARARDARDLVC
jgi:hypothetical protein